MQFDEQLDLLLNLLKKKKLSARKRVSREVRVSKINNSSYLT